MYLVFSEVIIYNAEEVKLINNAGKAWRDAPVFVVMYIERGISGVQALRSRTPQRTPTLRRVTLITLISITVIFTLMVYFMSNYLFQRSIDNAKTEDMNNAAQFSISLKDNLDYMSRLLYLTRQSLAEINFTSGIEASVSADHILISMLDLNPDMYCAWYILREGIYDDNRLFIGEYIKQDGAVVKSISINANEVSADPDSAPWYFQPLTTGNTYYTLAELYKYSYENEAVYAATISMPILDNGEIIGVCGIDILYSDIMQIIYDLHNR